MSNASIFGSVPFYNDNSAGESAFGSVGFIAADKPGDSAFGSVFFFHLTPWYASLFGQVFFGYEPPCVIDENYEYQAVFPTLPGVSWNRTRRPIWKTITQESVSGIETTAGLMAYPLYEWELTYDVLRGADTYIEFQKMLDFFNQQKGSAIPFRFFDWHDNYADNQTCGIGNGTQTQFQMMRLLVNTVDPVFAPFPDAKIFINGVQQSADSYSINAGMITFAVPPGNEMVVSWTGHYYWLVRFREDATDFEEFAYNFYENKKITLRSKKYAVQS